jgi:hypothetical protein
MTSRSRVSPAPKRRRLRARRGALLALLALVAVASSAIVAGAVITSAPSGHNLVAVGPVSSENGFPESYTDDANTRLELCVAPDPLCSAAPPLPDPTQPMSFPDNFADENFYSLVSAGLTTPAAGRATLTLATEAAFATGPVIAGDQITFGRVRIKVSGLTPGATYTVTHPYGVDRFVAEAGVNNINFTEDIGVAPGVFTGVLNSRIGPFLRWDSGAPAGYLGDPAQDHTVTGSPYGTNVFRIEGPDVGGSGVNVLSTDQFSVMGKVATNSGVNAVRATYSRPASASASTGGTVDVFAASEAQQALSVTGGSSFDETEMAGDAKRYFAHVDYAGAQPPSTVTVVNEGDKPVARSSVAVTDLVTLSQALYDVDAKTLRIAASSSDEASPPRLTATGFGPLDAGTLTVRGLSVAPPDVTVTSAAGGSATLAVQSVGAGFPPIPVQAFAGVDRTVQQGQSVTLDATGSTGTVKSYAWTQTSGTHVTLAGDTTAKPTFVAPGAAGDLELQVTVTGSGGPATDTVLVHVAAVQRPVADAGPDRAVAQGTTVRLDATGSTGATSYAWTSANPAVTLTGADTATPSFAFPKQTAPVTFTLTVTGPGGTASDTVAISGIDDPLTVTAGKARYTTSKREYDISGTATQLASNAITVHAGRTLGGAVLGTVAVDPLTGAWRFRVPNLALDASRTFSIESARGGRLLAVALQVQ